VCVCVCVCVCLSAAACPHYYTDPDVNWGLVGMPLVVHYWADLHSMHGLRCYGNITRTRNVSEYMLVLAVCLVFAVAHTNCHSEYLIFHKMLNRTSLDRLLDKTDSSGIFQRQGDRGDPRSA